MTEKERYGVDFKDFDCHIKQYWFPDVWRSLRISPLFGGQLMPPGLPSTGILHSLLYYGYYLVEIPHTQPPLEKIFISIWPWGRIQILFFFSEDILQVAVGGGERGVTPGRNPGRSTSDVKTVRLRPHELFRAGLIAPSSWYELLVVIVPRKVATRTNGRTDCLAEMTFQLSSPEEK